MNIILSLLICLMSFPVWAASVSFSKTEVGIGQSVELVFSSDTPITQAPDLSALKADFTVSGQSSGQSTTIINGRVSTSYTVSYTVFPKRNGTFTIDKLMLNGEKLNPVYLKVSEKQIGSASIPLTMQARVSEGPYYVGQAILYTLRMGDVSRITDGTFDAPNATGVSVKQVGSDDIRTVLQQGTPIKMLERNYLIMPEKSGQITLSPASFIGMRSIPADKRMSIADLFDQGILFDGLMGGGSQEQVFAESDPITLTITPKPTNWTGWWLASPMVELTYTDKVPDNLTSGATIERIITLTAKGVSAEALPVPVQAGTEDLKVYPADEVRDTFATDDTIEGRLTVSIVLMPTNGGQITIPAISVPWFNTATGQKEIATIESKTIMVNGPKVTNETIKQHRHNPLSNKPIHRWIKLYRWAEVL